MPKTLPIDRPGLSRPARATPTKSVPLGAIALFLLVYMAVLGVMFAPDGFFLSHSAPVAVAE